jgi:hypothetical protein
MIEKQMLEQQPNSDKMLIDTTSAQMPQNPMLAAVLIDGDGQKLHEGDRVFTYDAFASNHERIYGTLYKNSEFPNVSDYYVSYDDGEDCAVLDFTTIFKA